MPAKAITYGSQPNGNAKGKAKRVTKELAIAKRPAAPSWTSVKPYIAVNNDDDEKNDDPDNTEPDSRTTSLAQRHVFNMPRGSIGTDTLAKYDFYKSKACTTKGKERLANEIIIAMVPRCSGWGGRIEAKNTVIERLITKQRSRTDAQAQDGLRKLVFSSKIIHNNKKTFKEAIDAEEVWEKDGLWYYETRKKDIEQVSSSKTSGLTEMRCEAPHLIIDRIQTYLRCILDVS